MQLTIHYETMQIISIGLAQGSTHDFQLFKDQRKKQKYKAIMLVDKVYQGLSQLGVRCLIPFKAGKKQTINLIA